LSFFYSSGRYIYLFLLSLLRIILCARASVPSPSHTVFDPRIYTPQRPAAAVRVGAGGSEKPEWRLVRGGGWFVGGERRDVYIHTYIHIYIYTCRYVCMYTSVGEKSGKKWKTKKKKKKEERKNT